MLGTIEDQRHSFDRLCMFNGTNAMGGARRGYANNKQIDSVSLCVWEQPSLCNCSTPKILYVGLGTKSGSCDSHIRRLMVHTCDEASKIATSGLWPTLEGRRVVNFWSLSILKT